MNNRPSFSGGTWGALGEFQTVSGVETQNRVIDESRKIAVDTNAPVLIYWKDHEKDQKIPYAVVSASGDLIFLTQIQLRRILG